MKKINSKRPYCDCVHFFPSFITVTVKPLAGSATASMGDGTGTTASFNSPGQLIGNTVATDSSNNIYVLDRGNYRVRKITSTGVVTTYAGTGQSGGHADGVSIYCSFNGVASTYAAIALDSSANVYIGDYTYLRKVAIPYAVVSTIAGTASATYTDGFGTNAQFNYIGGLAINKQGTIYAVDTNNYLVRQITRSGTVTVLAGAYNTNSHADGSGTNANFYTPTSATIDSSGNIYVAEYYSVRKVTSLGMVTTLAGSATTVNGYADGFGTSALFQRIAGFTLASSGVIYLTDGNNLIRTVNSAGLVSTVMGSSTAALYDGSFSAAAFYNVRGLALDSNSNIYFVSNNDHAVRKANIPGKNYTRLSFSLVFFPFCFCPCFFFFY